MMNPYIDKAKVLIEALPYMNKFSGSTFVIKYGGSIMNDESLTESLVKDIVLMKRIGLNPVIVHGGGNALSKLLKQVNKETEFIDGFRVSDEETVEYAEMVFSGKVNKNLVKKFNMNDCPAIGISGVDNKIVVAKKKLINGKDIGNVGHITKINSGFVSSLISMNIIPIISPIGTDEDGNTYNINADEVAAHIASSIGAEKLIYLTDIDGVLDKNDELITKINPSESRKLKKEGVIYGGMMPKIDYSFFSLRNGTHNVHILNGMREHSILLEIFTDNGIGTMIELGGIDGDE